jgi:hypothetical protein
MHSAVLLFGKITAERIKRLKRAFRLVENKPIVAPARWKLLDYVCSVL